MADNLVEVRALVVDRGGRRVLDGLDLTIEQGSVTGLLGPSGCGKSTLMRSLVGVQQLTSGRVTIAGAEAGSTPLRSRVGYVTQAASVYDDLTVRENLAFFARVLGADREAVERAITTVDLTTHAEPWSAGSAAASARGRAWRWRCSTRPTCWCSTSRPSASTRCCGATCGRCSTGSPRTAPRCSSPAT